MIHAYNEQYLPIIQEKIALLFELAVLIEHIDIDDFAKKFAQSKVCKAFEETNPIYVLGKSANELLGIILNKDPIDVELNSSLSPEYWVGYVLSYAQWYFNKPYQILIDAYPCSKLLLQYFPYHEMDLSHSIALYMPHLSFINALKKYRALNNLSQSELSLLSNIPLRTIKAYEQGSVDISKAQVDTLYALAQTLHCTIEDLIL